MSEKKKENLNINLNPAQTPILYTDMVHMNTSEDGVTFDFCQKAGGSGQYHVVSRIGMSRDHAQKLAKKLGDILMLTTAHTQTKNKN